VYNVPEPADVSSVGPFTQNSRQGNPLVNEVTRNWRHCCR
jgi:hypothetical protein